MNDLDAVSLFSNCGAGDKGFAQAGFTFRVMAEVDERRLGVAALNHDKAVCVSGDLRNTWPEVVKSYRVGQSKGRVTLLSACPPCQGMSSARGHRGQESDARAGSRDHRNLLVEVIAQVAKELEPRLLVVENVPAFLSRLVLDPRDRQPISAAALLVDILRKEYQVYPFLADLADFGVPQRRVRAFLTFVRRNDLMLEHLEASEAVPYPSLQGLPGGGPIRRTLGDALAELRALPLDAKSQSDARDEQEPMHSVPVWGDDHRYRMVAAIPSGSGRRAWQNSCCDRCGEVEVGSDDAMCPECEGPLLRPVVRERDGSYRLVKGFRNSSYSRMSPNVPAATITTASGHVGSDLTVHPFENRVLSPLECAYLQTFPADFQWGDALQKWGTTHVRAMIGEAVPPRFTELHGQALVDLLAGHVEKLAKSNDPMVGKAWERLNRHLSVEGEIV
ncbi:DNA cytosine methyltransferase [Candidatus Poriferisocius sp.]|uniref:DNA cytosine methyltransferase n=1 Tax=Candidatus Poriferisocius sp. TaxID=3101276 RepID=UPI003B017594